MYYKWCRLLLCPRERWRSIAMSTSVCVCVCLSARISPEPHARSLPIFLCMLTMAVARSSSGSVTKSQGEGTILRISSPLTMHCNAFAAKWIIQSPITSCSRRDHCLCQASTNIEIRRLLSPGDAANRPGRRWWECTAPAKYGIHDRLPCLYAK